MNRASLHQTLIGLAVLLLIIATSGCGGGGGGSGAVSGLTYVGNTSAAVITSSNASTLVANIVGNSSAATSVTTTSATEGVSTASRVAGVLTLIRRLNGDVREALGPSPEVATTELPIIALVPVDDIEPCDSGSIHTTGTLNDNLTGTLNTNFMSCRFGNETVNGQATLTISAVDLGALIPTDATFSFGSLTFQSSTFDATVSGSIRSQLDLSTNTETLTANLVTQDNISGEMTKAENLVIVIVYDNIPFPSSFSESVTGRVFDSVHGFVDITTPTPLFFGTLDQEFPDSGQLVLTGDNNVSIRVTVLSVTLAMMELDLDGDSVYEISAIVEWLQLPNSVSADLDDSDGDGMHNSWEDEQGFDPLDPSDAAQDPDGDGFTNLQEYQNGTDPTLSGSFPLTADLSITKTALVDTVFVGTTFSYRLSASNAGPNTAVNVQVQDILPSSLSFVSAAGGGWSCSNSNGMVTCTRASLTFGVAPFITVMVEAPSTSDSVSNTASVSSNTLDPNDANDSATEITDILPIAASLNLDLGAPAFDMELDTARQLLYVSVPSLNEVVIVSLDGFTVLNRVGVGSNPHGIDLSQDGNTLYIALNEGGAVAMLDLETLSVSEVAVFVELDTMQVYDVSAATLTEVFASGNPGSFGFAYIVKIDTANGNLVTRVGSDRIIRADPFFVASADQQFLYIGEGFSPNSVYKLDLTQPDAPLALKDSNGSIIFGGSDHLAINPDGSLLFLASGQVLDTNTLTQAGLIGAGVSAVSGDGARIYVGRAPNAIRVYDTATFAEIDATGTACDITDIERIIELQANVKWILLGQQTVCRVSTGP